MKKILVNEWKLIATATGQALVFTGIGFAFGLVSLVLLVIR